jgi:hypothetical protein
LFSWLHAQQTKHIVIVVIDGARYTETFGDTSHANIPHIWNDLRPLGTMYTAFSNEGQTVTIPGHASILTGTWQYLPNDGTQRPTQPTIFEYFRKQFGAESTTCWVALGKSKLDVLSSSTHPQYGMEYTASIRTSNDEYNDSVACDNAGWVLRNYHPSLTIVNFPQTDNRGHGGVWDEYLAALRNADAFAASLWGLIQEDTLLHNRTTMILTNDHGRHTYNFSGHGDGCEGCRHILLLILGPDTPADVVDDLPATQIDIAPTIGALMKFATPYSSGTLISSAIGESRPNTPGNAPGAYILHQNYPNPFNPKTTISYQIFVSGQVILKVYDMFGRETATLVDGTQEANLYEIPFEGRNLASGVYFYSLQVGGLKESRKMIFLK